VRPPLLTPKASLTWSADGSTVTKRFVQLPANELLGTQAGAFANEAKVNGLLRDEEPPVPVAALLAVDRAGQALTFEAIPGEPLGPKFPSDLDHEAIEGLVRLVAALDGYRPNPPWLRRFPLERRLGLHVAAGLLDEGDADLLRAAAGDLAAWSFAHGDVTARNVLRRDDGALVLIDWEWAGLHPPLYDVAFLWFSLAHDQEGRRRVAATVAEVDQTPFLVSVVLIELLHLHMWQRRGNPTTPFEAQHAAQHVIDLEALRARAGQPRRAPAGGPLPAGGSPSATAATRTDATPPRLPRLR